MRRLRRAAPFLVLCAALLAGGAEGTGARETTAQAARQLPAALSDSAFWRLVTELSEPSGYFRSDNLVSNEVTFQHVIPELQQIAGQGSVYLGVGPDQNFTYAVALRPRLAFIVDIRRDNLLLHLLYKAIIELSADRGEFLSLLFSRPRPAEAVGDATADALFAAYHTVSGDRARFAENLTRLRDHLARQHGFPLSAADLSGIEYVYRAFFEAGPQITYSFGPAARGGFGGWRGMPTYEELMVETDADSVPRGYLASEEHFALLRQLQLANRIVPIVGDFAGDKALRSLGRYLASHGATVSAIYTSNVEQYLFQGNDAWRRYYENVATLPLEEHAVFIRAVFNYGGWRNSLGGVRVPRSVTMLSPVSDIVSAARGGSVQSYWDVIQLSRAPVVPAPR